MDLETIFPHNKRISHCYVSLLEGIIDFGIPIFCTFSLLVGASSHDWLEIPPFEDIFRTYHGLNFPNLFIILVAINQVFLGI